MADSLTTQEIADTERAYYSYKEMSCRHHDPTWLRPSRASSRVVNITYEEAHHRSNKVPPVKHQGGPVMLQQHIPEAVNLINHFNADEITITCNNGAVITITISGPVTI